MLLAKPITIYSCLWPRVRRIDIIGVDSTIWVGVRLPKEEAINEQASV
jgi:hypothetical protein